MKRDLDFPPILMTDEERADQLREMNEAHMRENFLRGLQAQQDLAAARVMLIGLAVATGAVVIVITALVAGWISR